MIFNRRVLFFILIFCFCFLYPKKAYTQSCLPCDVVGETTNSLLYDFDGNRKIDEQDIFLYTTRCLNQTCGNNICPNFYLDDSTTCNHLDVNCLGSCYSSTVSITPLPRLCLPCSDSSYDRNNNGSIDIEDLISYTLQCSVSICSDSTCVDYYQDAKCSSLDLGCIGACYMRSFVSPTSPRGFPIPTDEISPAQNQNPAVPCNCVNREGRYNQCNSTCVDGNNNTLANFACAGIENCTGPAIRTKGDVNGDRKVCLDDYIELVLTFSGKYANDDVKRLRSDFQGNNFIDHEDKSIFDANYDPESCSTNF